MKALLLSLAFFPMIASAKTVYVLNRAVVQDAKFQGFAIRSDKDLRRQNLFGMTQLADLTIQALDLNQAYKCEIDGTPSYLTADTSTGNSDTIFLYKVYSISGCVDVTRTELVRNAQERLR